MGLPIPCPPIPLPDSPQGLHRPPDHKHPTIAAESPEMALLRVHLSFASAAPPARSRSLVQARYVVKAFNSNKNKSKGITVQVCMSHEFCFARGVLCVAAAGAC